MANIPEDPGLGMVSSPQTAVKLDAGALTAPNRAAMQRADAVQGLSGQAFDIGQKMQEAKNTADLIDAQGKLARTRQTFIEQLQTKPDETKWGEDWQSTVKETQESILGKESKLAPDVKQRLALEIKDWGNTTGIDVRVMANKATNQRGALKIDNAVDEFAKDGNYNAAAQSIDAGTKAGFWFPEEGDAKKNQVGQKIDFYAAKNYIDNHPVGAADYLNDKTPTGRYRNLTNLDPTQRDALITEARRKGNEAQADTLSGITGAYDANPENALTRPQLDEMVKSGKISQKGATSYTQLVEKTNLKNARNDAAQLTMKVHDWDFSVSKNPEEKAREFKDESAALPATIRKPIWDLIDNKLDAAKKGTKLPTDYGARFAGDLLKEGKFGPMKVKDDGTVTATPTEETYAAYYDTMEKLDEYRKQHPKATFEEERQQLAKWTVASRVKSAHNSFSVQNYLSQPDANDTNSPASGDPGN